MSHHIRRKIISFLALSAVGASLGVIESRAADERDLILANRLFQRLTGSRLSVRDPVLVQMGDLLAAGRGTEAAAIATARPGFINHLVFQFAAEISDEEGSRRGVRRLYESSARTILVIRNNLPIRNILIEREQFPAVVASACVNDGDPFRCASDRSLDLSSSAVMTFQGTRQARLESQNVRVPKGDGTTDTVPLVYAAELPNGNEDTAGILSDRGFGNIAYRAGTNRRGIQQMVRQLWGLPLDNIRSQIPSDRYVRTDVPRNPEGTGSSLYITKCKTCHSIIDGFAQAFAYWDSQGGDNGTLLYKTNGVVGKYALNQSAYPQGYRVTTNNWQSMFTPAQLEAFGWSGATQGKGVYALANAVAQSKQFYRGMVNKVISFVCPNLDPDNPATAILKPEVIDAVVNNLQVQQNLRRAFETVAARPECLGPK